MAETRPKSRGIRFLQRVWPWMVGIAILAVIATRVPYATFRAALGRGPHFDLAAVDLLVVIVTLCTDSIATWISLMALKMARPLRHVLAVRGATFVLFMINYALGQGGFGYYLHRTGTPALRAVGATLFLIGTNLAALLVMTSVASALGPTVDVRLWWTLMIGCAGYLIYLVIIWLVPSSLARREILAPLFDAGLRGHALAMLVRLPHVLVMCFGVWAAIRVWGIPVPLGTVFTIMPIVVIASALPIAPAGLGTTQAALVLFFSQYAQGASDVDRAAAVLAFAIVHFVYGLLSVFAVGLICIPIARKAGVMPTRTAPT